MFFAAKIACSGIVCSLMTPWISGPGQTPFHAGVVVGSEVAGIALPADVNDDVNKVQQTLLDEGYYRGKVDGVLGLRTRASIRGFQKDEHLPVTGQLDLRTASKLGVRPEGPVATSDEITQDKPSAGIKRDAGSWRANKRPHTLAEKLVPTVPPV